MWNLIRWVSPRTIKETFTPPTRLPLPVPMADDARTVESRHVPGDGALPCASVRP